MSHDCACATKIVYSPISVRCAGEIFPHNALVEGSLVRFPLCRSTESPSLRVSFNFLRVVNGDKRHPVTGGQVFHDIERDLFACQFVQSEALAFKDLAPDACLVPVCLGAVGGKLGDERAIYLVSHPAYSFVERGVASPRDDL